MYFAAATQTSTCLTIHSPGFPFSFFSESTDVYISNTRGNNITLKAFSCHMTSLLGCAVHSIGIQKKISWFPMCVYRLLSVPPDWRIQWGTGLISIIECSVQWIWHGMVQSSFFFKAPPSSVSGVVNSAVTGDKETVAGQPLSSYCHRHVRLGRDMVSSDYTPLIGRIFYCGTWQHETQHGICFFFKENHHRQAWKKQRCPGRKNIDSYAKNVVLLQCICLFPNLEWMRWKVTSLLGAGIQDVKSTAASFGTGHRSAKGKSLHTYWCNAGFQE